MGRWREVALERELARVRWNGARGGLGWRWVGCGVFFLICHNCHFLSVAFFYFGG